MIDRFGPLPKPAETLLLETEIRILAGAWKLDRIHVEQGWYAVLTYSDTTRIEALGPPAPRLGAHRRRQESLRSTGRRPGQDARNRQRLLTLLRL